MSLVYVKFLRSCADLQYGSADIIYKWMLPLPTTEAAEGSFVLLAITPASE